MSLCMSYIRELFSLFPYRQQEQMRHVSRRFDHTLHHYPPSPRVRPDFQNAGIKLIPHNTHRRTTYDNEGFFAKANFYRFHDWNWQRLEFGRCCEELKESTQQLSGELMIPGASNNDTVELRMEEKGFFSLLHVRNQLTPATAFAAVHALRHMGECWFYYISVIDRPFIVNPLALRLARRGSEKRFQLYAKHANIVANGCMALSRVGPLHHSYITIYAQLTKLGALELEFAGYEFSVDDTLAVLVAHDGRRFARRVKMYLRSRVENFGKMIECFRYHVQDPSKLITTEMMILADSKNSSPSTLYLPALESCGGVCVLRSATEVLYQLVNEPSATTFTVSVPLQPELNDEELRGKYLAVLSWDKQNQ